MAFLYWDIVQLVECVFWEHKIASSRIAIPAKEKEKFMYKLGRAILTIIWIIDILNFPCVEFLDTIFPINTLAWFLIWLFLPSND